MIGRMCPCCRNVPVAELRMDPRLIDEIVDFTSRVAEVAADLCERGLAFECSRLTDALDRLDFVEVE